MSDILYFEVEADFLIQTWPDLPKVIIICILILSKLRIKLHSLQDLTMK